MDTRKIIKKISEENNADYNDLKAIIENNENDEFLFECADKIRREIYGTDVYIRGLIEISNFCKNNCLYCGIRRDNANLERYRLNEGDIYECCEEGYSLGFRTFVMQSGEDSFYSDKMLCRIIEKIKEKYPDCAVTLSIGERSEESYKCLFESGADRFLLRHETASAEHYSKLHPSEMSFENRIKCLETLKKIGYQTGSGFMVGSPFQTTDNLIKDLLFIKKLKPEMVGIGPFIPHCETPFKEFSQGRLRETLVMISLVRLLLPNSLIPATTALGTIHPNGRELGLKAGANVVMPNLSPIKFRKLYSLYNNKICTGDESAQAIKHLKESVEKYGYKIVTDRGDFRA